MTLLDVFTTFFYRLVVTPIETFVSASSFIAIFTFFATPSILIQNSISSVLPRKSSSTYHPRLTRNLRLRRLFVLLHCCQRAHIPSKTTPASLHSCLQPNVRFAPRSNKSVKSSSRRHRRESRHRFSARSKRERMRSSPSPNSDLPLPDFVPPLPQLHYFDCYDTLDEILFFDALQVVPGVFSACYDSFDSQTGDYYNRFFDSSLFDIYHDTITDPDVSDIDYTPRSASTSSAEALRTLYQSDLGLIPYPPSSIEPFLSSFNVLNHYRTILNIPSYTNKRRLLPGSPIYNQILLNARGLQARLRSYGEVIPLHEPIIYHSTTDNELPIVIDTGASCSITLQGTAKEKFPTLRVLGPRLISSRFVTGSGEVEVGGVMIDCGVLQ